jgi:hypothetical protein
MKAIFDTCNICSILHHAWWVFAIVAVLIAIRTSFLKYVAVRLFVWGGLVGLASTYIVELYANPTDRVALDQLVAVLFAYGTALYASICDLLQIRYARLLTKWRGEKWAKELDYPYLFFGALGLIISVNRLEAIEHRLTGFEIIGPLIVTTAIVIRLVKTRVEIAGWNKDLS